jgi:hypothetical protein
MTARVAALVAGLCGTFALGCGGQGGGSPTRPPTATAEQVRKLWSGPSSTVALDAKRLSTRFQAAGLMRTGRYPALGRPASDLRALLGSPEKTLRSRKDHVTYWYYTLIRADEGRPDCVSRLRVQVEPSGEVSSLGYDRPVPDACSA